MTDMSKQNAADHLTREQMLSKVNELIKNIKMAMLTTESEEGMLHSRPMATQEADFDGTLWFFTSANSSKAADLEWNPEVNVSYAQPSDTKYVSLSGSGEIVRDRAKMQELWNDIYRAWFPLGLDDPNVALLRVDVTVAEYWEAASGKMVQLFGYLQAMATGRPANVGEHGSMEVGAGKARRAAAGHDNSDAIESHT